MSLINNANPGSQIYIMTIIFRALASAKNSISVQDLMSICRPEALPRNENQRDKFVPELRFWANSDHSLWSIDEHDMVSLNQEFSGNPDYRHISNSVRQVIMSTDLDSVFGREDKNDGISVLIRTLCMLLASDQFLPLSDSPLQKDSFVSINSKFLPSNRINSSNEFPVFLEYIHFLGFLSPVENNSFWIDPTVAISSQLPAIFSSEKRLPIRQFIEKLASMLPVFDGSRYRLEVENKMQARGWEKIGENRISRSLAYSLESLRLSNNIEIEPGADDVQMMLLPTNEGERPISFIKLI